MKRSDRVSNQEIERYISLRNKKEILYKRMQELSENTDTKEKERLEREYRDVSDEYDKIHERISTWRLKVERLARKLSEKSDGADLKGFDEDLEEFTESLLDYYEAQKEKLQDMMKILNGQMDLGFVEKIQRWLLVRKMKKIEKEYTERQMMFSDLTKHSE